MIAYVCMCTKGLRLFTLATLSVISSQRFRTDKCNLQLGNNSYVDISKINRVTSYRQAWHNNNVVAKQQAF